MTFTTLDIIVRRYLLENRLTLHWYVQSMTLGASAVRILSEDTLRIINTVELNLDANSAVTLPNDFKDVISLGMPNGQFVQPTPQRSSINRLHNYDTSHNVIPFDQPSADSSNFWGYWPGWFWFWNTDSLGENTGRFFGSDSGNTTDQWKIIRERNQIQLTQTWRASSCLLQYVSDGQTADNASQIDSRAFDAVQAYISWKSSPGAISKDSPQGREFYHQKKLLRSRMNEITIADLKRILYSNYKAGIKN